MRWRTRTDFAAARLLAVLGFSALAACAAPPDHLRYNSATVRSAGLDRHLESGSFDVYECLLTGSDGHLDLEGSAGTIGFCIDESNTTGIARIHTNASRSELCFWRDTGTCSEDGVCESWTIADDCMDLARPLWTETQ